MKKYTILLAGLILLGSCKKWLDIQPESQVSRDELFKTQEGFQEALNGVYTRCTGLDIYGDELSFGFPDVLAQTYTISSFTGPSSYVETAKFNYTDNDFINRKDKVWSGIYNAIVNANVIIANIDAKKDIFSGNNYNLIKGEALALRAYLHFDILRLFGSAYFAGSANMVGIPYVTTYSNQTTPVSSTAEALQKMITDLLAAKQLLSSADSIRSSNYIVGYPFSTTDAALYPADAGNETASNDLFQQNRRHRLNYYAVCGELARVYLWQGDKTNALANAKEVIDSRKFPWTKQSWFISTDVKKVDRICYNELLFAWYIPKSLQSLQNRFENGSSGFYIETGSGDAIYESNGVGGSDLRYKQWLQFGTSSSQKLIYKYKRNLDAQADDATANLYPLVVPAIRLSEMYYIAAECTYDNDPVSAQAYIDVVRANRGIGTHLAVSSREEFLKELLKEARKEFIGEGQVFYMYKRLNRAIVGQSGNLISPSAALFNLPWPNDEIQFGGR